MSISKEELEHIINAPEFDADDPDPDEYSSLDKGLARELLALRAQLAVLVKQRKLYGN